MSSNESTTASVKVNWQLARSMVEPLYQGQSLGTGEPRLAHADGMASILRGIRDDDELIAAAYLFSAHNYLKNPDEWIEKSFGSRVKGLCSDMQRLTKLSNQARSSNKEANAASQPEKLRKMLLAMCGDLRVVLLRLASRLQTLRWFVKHPSPEAASFGAETLHLYSPLANRLGIWQMKWELEDLSLRFTKPEVYEAIVKDLDASRAERLAFVQKAVSKIRSTLAEHGIRSDVSGRSKHIYSIWLKMERKHLTFDRLFDLRALRVIVDTVEQCYEALSILTETFTMIESEYDDYIAHPKPNGYRSLHTVMRASDGRPVEIQIRTRAMHEYAELGFAAHWRYKEAGNSLGVASSEEQKVVWLRQLLAWHSDVEPPKPGVAEELVYALTPMGRVVELQAGGTPVDFAYMVHTQLGHRCRGAKVNGAMVPLTHKLKTGDTVDILTAKTGGPSRDWMNPELGYAAMARTRGKVRTWFNQQQLEEQKERGREKLDKELARLGKSTFKLEELAKTLGFDSVDDLCVTIARDEISSRAIENAVIPPVQKKTEEEAEKPVIKEAQPRSGAEKGKVLVVGVDSLLTQLARCCHPVPPDEIVGFVSRGRGVVVHRADCPNVRNLLENSRERLIDVSWGEVSEDALYPMEVLVLAQDRIGLLKEVSDVFIRLKINITKVNTQSVKNVARLRFGVEVAGAALFRQAVKEILAIKGVISARRS